MDYLELLSSYKSVLIIGTYPPPLGGVSVHIYRLHKILPNSSVFDLSKKQSFPFENALKLFFQLLFHKYDAIHVHSFRAKYLLIILITHLVKKFHIFVTDHNSRLLEDANAFEQKIIRKFISSLYCFIAVGEHIPDTYRNKGINLPSKVIIQNAFLPPPEEDEPKILKTYPEDLRVFLNSHFPILTGNAYQLSFYQNTDLYGLDLCIELTEKLKQDFNNIGFIFAIADKSKNPEYLNKMIARIKKKGIENNFYILSGQKEIWPMFKKSNLLVRPTNTDGYGISIDEALFFGSKAIASDVCKRNKKAVVFENRNIEDLYNKSKEILKNCTFRPINF